LRHIDHFEQAMTKIAKKKVSAARRPRLKKQTAKAAPERVGSATQILQVAAKLMRQKGYEATTIRDIAKEVGIKAASIYHHFPSKDDIVQRVVIEGTRVVCEAVAEALAALPLKSSPRQRLETAIRAHLLSALEHSDFTSASIRVFAFLPPTVREQCRLERRKYEDIWRTIMADLSEDGIIPSSVSPHSVRLLLLGALNWAGEWYRPGRLSIDKIAHDFAASICPIPKT
jgi:TetR/AcrR family transcriptional regulator, cholesterol catabolism regulator